MTDLDTEKKYYTETSINITFIVLTTFMALFYGVLPYFGFYYLYDKLEWYHYLVLTFFTGAGVFTFSFVIKTLKNWRGTLFLVVASDHVECLPYTKSDMGGPATFQGLYNFTYTRKDLVSIPYSEVKSVEDATNFWTGKYFRIIKNDDSKMEIPVFFQYKKDRLLMLEDLKSKLENYKHSNSDD